MGSSLCQPSPNIDILNDVERTKMNEDINNIITYNLNFTDLALKYRETILKKGKKETSIFLIHLLKIYMIKMYTTILAF